MNDTAKVRKVSTLVAKRNSLGRLMSTFRKSIRMGIWYCADSVQTPFDLRLNYVACLEASYFLGLSWRLPP
jgi:hypothetical protein